MIIKGGSRAGPTSLANHLQKDTNERVTVVEIAGLAATDIPGALKEIMALTAGTHCRDGMYHASISAAPGEPEMTPEQRARAVEILADELGLSEQPRLVVEHQKVGESGIERTHQHVVFGRVDEDGKTISDFQNYPAHERAARAIEVELNHQRTPGAFDRDDGTLRPERTPGHDEYQQAERSGLSPKEAKALLTELWQQSDSGKAFVEAAAEQGFIVCQGNKCLLVMDEAGDHVRLSRRLPNSAAEIAARIGEVREALPTLDEARAALDRDAPAPAVETALQGHEAVSGMDMAAGDRDPSPALSLAPDEPSLEPGETESLGAGALEGRTAPDDRGAGTGADRFADEPPQPMRAAADPPDHMSKGLDVAAGVAVRTVGAAVEVAADIGEGLLGLMVGVGGPIDASPPKVEPKRDRPMSQSAAPPSAPTPTNVFSEYARARLSGAEMTDIQRQASDRAQALQKKDRDFER